MIILGNQKVVFGVNGRFELIDYAPDNILLLY